MKKMRYALRELFIESFSDGVMGFIIGILAWLAALIAATALFVLTDCLAASTSEQMVKVLGKRFEESHVTYQTTLVGKSTIVTPIYHPDSWYVSVWFDGGEASCSISEGEFNSVKNGTKAMANVGSGFLSSAKYCHEFHGEYNN